MSSVAVLRRAAAFLVVGLGLWVSWRYTMVTWTAESDAADPYVLWVGYHEHGWAFLRTYVYAPDNWLLWPLPLLFAGFALFSDAPWLPFAVGWVLFAACAGGVFLVLRRVAGPTAAWSAAVAVLLSSRPAIGELGFLTYPVSHNSSLLLALLGLHGAILWLERRHLPALAWAVVLLTMAGVSDPWTEVAFTLPMGAGAVLLLAPPGQRALRGRAFGLGLALAAVLLLDHTHLLGALGFLPVQPVVFASGAAREAALPWLVQFATLWFDFLPHWNAAYWRLPDASDTLVDLVLLGAGAVAVAVWLVRGGDRSPGLLLLAATSVVSAVITVAAYVLLDVARTFATARYFMNVDILAIMLFAAAAARAWPELGRSARAVVAVYALMLPAAGLASAPAAWSRGGLHTPLPGIPPWDNGVIGLAAFLQAHGLREGYGSYWGNEANAVRWITRGAVVMHPVGYEPGTGIPSPFFIQVSPFWYAADPAADPARRSFLAITPGFDGCPDEALCAQAAERRWGPAAERLRYGAMLVLVWDHKLFGTERTRPPVTPLAADAPSGPEPPADAARR